MSIYPENYLYTKDHEWVLIQNDTGTVGITYHAQRELGDIVFVDLPKLGTVVEQGKPLGSVESVKAVSDIYAPVSGEVIAVNEALSAAPEKLNQDPHGAAWLVKLRLNNPEEAKSLLSAADYRAYVGAEG
ncbi:MAG: glycine cleavage system protein GcvH [Bryobacterales bacterium]|nr:glycine cleavage system protein GcvH [Bryobacteraceae bacterium]MDW8353351.1 glycine cleavage system protein GcvH [Bryobacterales bacterium]